MKLTLSSSTCLVFSLLVCSTLIAQNPVVTFVSSKDNTLYEHASGSLSNGAGTRMFCGRTDNSKLRRAVFAFDVASNVPPCSTIVSVSVQLRCVQSNSGSEPATLHTILGDWGEAGSAPSGAGGGGGNGGAAQPSDATWIHRFFPATMWASAGGDFAAGASASFSADQSGYYTVASTAQLEADVQGWLDNPSSNFGWLLKGNESVDLTAKAWATKEDSNAAYRPALTVTYTPAASASVVVTGTGCIGSSGVPLSFSAIGLPTIGVPGFGLSISGGPPLGMAQIYLAMASGPPVPLGSGCYLYLDIASALAFISSGVSPLTLPLNSSGSFTLPFPVLDCGFAGFTTAAQVLMFDTTGLITSEALTLNFGM